jgi:hypothetical protein
MIAAAEGGDDIMVMKLAFTGESQSVSTAVPGNAAFNLRLV